jgi:hypothetical protein
MNLMTVGALFQIRDFTWEKSICLYNQYAESNCEPLICSDDEGNFGDTDAADGEQDNGNFDDTDVEDGKQDDARLENFNFICAIHCLLIVERVVG